MPADALPRYEQELRAFLAPLGVDLDAQAVCFQLYRTSTDVIAAFEARALRPLGLSHTGFALLTTIWVGGPQEVRSLARKLRLSKPSITSAIGTLERAGLVQRERSTEGRQLVSVTLTAGGGGAGGGGPVPHVPRLHEHSPRGVWQSRSHRGVRP